MKLYVNQSVYHYLPNALFVIIHIMLKQLVDFQLKSICNYVCQAANLKSSTAIDQYVILLLDEMHIKESLVYCMISTLEILLALQI